MLKKMTLALFLAGALAMTTGCLSQYEEDPADMIEDNGGIEDVDDGFED